MKSILSETEPNPVELVAGRADSPFLITCDHGGRLLPKSCGTLGLNVEQTRAHIAWDIGAAGVARELARLLGAPLVLQNYSRLLIDCNRPPAAASSIPEVSESTRIPGNLRLTDDQRQARRTAFFAPYHQAIAGQLDQRANGGLRTLLISLHSFTPVFKGLRRDLDIGILFNRDPRLGHILLELLGAEPTLRVMANQPYAVSDQTDYTIPIHGETRGIPHVMIEIRNSLIEHEPDQLQWAGRFADWLQRADQRLGADVQLEADRQIKPVTARTATVS